MRDEENEWKAFTERRAAVRRGDLQPGCECEPADMFDDGKELRCEVCKKPMVTRR